MSQNPTIPAASDAHKQMPFDRIVGSIGVPMYLFGASLASLLALSWFFVLPHVTRFQVGAQMLGTTEVIGYREGLEEKIRALEDKRDALLLPVHDPLYTALRDERMSQMMPERLRQELLSIASVSTGRADAVAIRKFGVNFGARTVHIEGVVQNVGVQSMTVLAQYVEALESAPFVASLTRPVFTREEEPKGTFSSPFAIDIVLKTLSEND